MDVAMGKLDQFLKETALAVQNVGKFNFSLRTRTHTPKAQFNL